MERTNSETVRILQISGVSAIFQKDNGRIVKLPIIPTFPGLLLAVGFVGTGGRNVNL